MQNKIEHTSAAGVNFEPNKKLGYYLVNNQIYYNKFHALIDASKTNQQIRWFFNEHAFVKFPWHVEPEESLDELYRQRAQGLRDQYDYIRVESSGGSDSTNVIFSFLLNNIHLDEVVFRYPKDGDKDLTGNARDIRSENTLSEWEFAAKPLLDWIATNYPAVKITVYNYTEKLIEDADSKDESWIFRTRHYLQPGHVNKYQAIATDDHKKLAEHNLRICVLWGVDKPKITLKDGKFFLYFNDGQASHSDQAIGEYTNISNEFFYWSPDACKLLAKQAHIIKNWFEMPVHYNMQSVINWPNSNFAGRTIYEQVIKSIVYPKYDLKTFQTNKPTNNIWNEMDYWFHYNFKDTKPHQVWQAGIDYVIDTLDPKYLSKIHNKIANIEMFDSPLYCFGDSSIPELNLPFAPSKDTKNKKTGNRWAILDPAMPHRHIINGRLVVY
jgi:hypothetical protein